MSFCLPPPGASAFVNLLTVFVTYVVAEDGGGGAVRCDRREAREWECFRLHRVSEDRVALQASNGQFVQAWSRLLGLLGTGLSADYASICAASCFHVRMAQPDVYIFATAHGLVSFLDNGTLMCDCSVIGDHSWLILVAAGLHLHPYGRRELPLTPPVVDWSCNAVHIGAQTRRSITEVWRFSYARTR